MAFLNEIGVEALWQAIKSADSKLQSKIDARPKCATGSYTGTGKCGSANPCSLTFDFEPKLVAISKDAGFTSYSKAASDSSYHGTYVATPTFAIRGQSTGFAYYYSGSTTQTELTWSDTGLSWYNDTTASAQLNDSAVTFYYIAIG